jgi:hypothetical protein
MVHSLENIYQRIIALHQDLLQDQLKSNLSYLVHLGKEYYFHFNLSLRTECISLIQVDSFYGKLDIAINLELLKQYLVGQIHQGLAH